MKTHHNYFCATGSIVLAVSALIFSGCFHSEKPTVAKPVKVTVQPVSYSGTSDSRSFSGTVESAEKSVVSFSVGGTIIGIYVEEGQKVAKGQVLARVRSSNYENAGNIADAELAEARDAYNRLKKLHDADALPEIKWVEVQNKLKQAENAAEMSKRAISDATLRSPVGGVVSRKIANVGQTIIPAEPVLELVTVNDLEIAISVPESEIGKINEGEPAVINFKSIEMDSVFGKVSKKAVVADPLTRAYTVKITIPDTHGKVLPGMVGDVVIKGNSDIESKPSSDVLLPSQAVLLDSDNRNFVWLVEKGKAARRFVKANDLSSGGIIVTEGLVAGDSVIVAGMQKVGTGTPVTCVTAKSF